MIVGSSHLSMLSRLPHDLTCSLSPVPQRDWVPGPNVI